MSELIIRKIVRVTEEIRREVDRPLERPIRMIAVAAVVKNPWAGLGYVENLRTDILALAPKLGDELVPMIVKEAGGGEAIEAYGKAAVVGMTGEIEHASGFIHTLRFGNKFREAVGGTSFLSFTNKRSGPGGSIQIPMIHKIDAGQRSHYVTMEFSIADAPDTNEIVVAIGVATGGRAFPRIGNRYIDMEEMGLTSKNDH
jgi:Amino acid synthesis